jgi:hypothetical protein
MNTTGDDELQGSQETWSSAESLSIEQLARTAPFPIYGLIETPNDLTLHGIGYSTADSGWGNPAPPSHPNPSPFLWQVNLIYGYPPGHPDVSPRLELITTSLTGVPMPVPTIEDLVRASATHYQSADEVPPLGSQPASFLIECFALNDGQALAVVAYTPNAPRSRCYKRMRLEFTNTR